MVYRKVREEFCTTLTVPFHLLELRLMRREYKATIRKFAKRGNYTFRICIYCHNNVCLKSQSLEIILSIHNID